MKQTSRIELMKTWFGLPFKTLQRREGQNSEPGSRGRNKRTQLPFILATFCLFPCGYWLYSIAKVSSKLASLERLHPGVGVSVDFQLKPSFPVTSIATVTALVLITVSWFKSPRWCRVVLPFYLFLIIKLVVWFFDSSGGGVGP